MFLPVAENVPLAPLTTLGVGGDARYFRPFVTESSLVEAIAFANERELPVFLLGGGSNVVIADTGFDGLVLSPRSVQVSVSNVSTARRGTHRLTADAGVDWDAFVRYAVNLNYSGLECLAGIPGLVGGTPVQNVGAYGQEVAETITSVRAYDRVTDEIVTLTGEECHFSYRRSRFNHEEASRWIILAVEFALKKDGKPTLRYADLQHYFGVEADPSLSDVYHAVRTIRARKGMVLDAEDSDTRSAGSFFKNPVVTAETFQTIQAEAERRGLSSVPGYSQSDGMMKIPAAWLMEKAGLKKGQTFGNGMVGLSTKHVLALTNRGGAMANDIVSAAREVQQRVSDAWGVLLAPEPVFVGFTDTDELPALATIARSYNESKRTQK